MFRKILDGTPCRKRSRGPQTPALLLTGHLLFDVAAGLIGGTLAYFVQAGVVKDAVQYVSNQNNWLPATIFVFVTVTPVVLLEFSALGRRFPAFRIASFLGVMVGTFLYIGGRLVNE